ncbi:MAG: hypothetical protein E7591_00910 [Ruminococcaceae bacterium]|nr:hypothetical protein [Oscillospiraceae bacterium]
MSMKDETKVEKTQVAPAEETKVDKRHEALVKKLKSKVNIKIPRTRDGDAPVYVLWNQKDYKIARGYAVEVPYPVYKALVRAKYDPIVC